MWWLSVFKRTQCFLKEQPGANLNTSTVLVFLFGIKLNYRRLIKNLMRGFSKQ